MSNSVFIACVVCQQLMILLTTRFFGAVLNLTGIDVLKGSLFYLKFVYLFGRMSSSITMTSTCLTSIDRFLATSHNVRCRHVFTVRRARLTLIIMVLII